MISKIGRINCISNLWSSVCKVWNKVMASTTWKLGNGKKAYFWKDCWFKQGECLRDVTDKSLTVSELEETVSEFMLPNGDWNREKLQSCLLEDICREVLNYHVRGSINKDDYIVWNHPEEVEFSVKSAYRDLAKE